MTVHSTWLTEHLHDLRAGLTSVDRQQDRIESWGARLADRLVAGGRLLTAGNGGSAAEAQHLTAELVGKFDHDRRPLSGVCLSAESSSVTAILNDYGADDVFARQVAAHGRAGDVLMLLSTSGRSPNVLRAAFRGRDLGLQVWAMTGRAPNPLTAAVDEYVAVDARSTAAVQECHLVVLHAVCAVLDEALERRARANGRVSRPAAAAQLR